MSDPTRPDLTRRRFLSRLGLAGALAATAGASGVTLEHLLARAESTPLGDDSRVLVLVTMYGGNDGINTVIPYADNAYHDARPELAYAPGEVLHLDGQLGLNPAMNGMAALWQRGELAIVRGVGYPQPDHSHFRSMDIWQTASPADPVPTGWIGRWLDVSGDDPVRAVNVGSVLPTLAVGARAMAATLDPAGHRLGTSAATELAGLGRPDAHDSAAAAMVCSSYRAEHTTASALAPAVSAAGRAKLHGSSLKTQLDLVARCIKAGVPTRVYSVSLNGFDTHADERGTQQALLGQLDAAVSGFLWEMAADRRGRQVVLMAYSEFGRRVRANASQGTDHGTSGPVFIGGAPVKGGFYGDEPSLTDLDDGDLKSTTDFRDIYAELLENVIGTDPAAVVGPGRKPIGVVA